MGREHDAALRDQSGVAPENLTTLPHFSVSSAMSSAKSAGVPPSPSTPRSASRPFIFGSSSPSLISLLSLSTIWRGVFLGAPRPNHALASTQAKNSATVGTCGRSGERDVVVTAKARSLPALI